MHGIGSLMNPRFLPHTTESGSKVQYTILVCQTPPQAIRHHITNARFTMMLSTTPNVTSDVYESITMTIPNPRS
jgi:hypothetical protein